MGGSDWIGYCGTFIGYLIKFKTIFPISLGQIKSKSGRYTYTYEDRNFCEIESKDNIKISEAWKAYLEKHDLSEAFEDYEELEFSKAYPAWTGGCDSSPAEDSILIMGYKLEMQNSNGKHRVVNIWYIFPDNFDDLYSEFLIEFVAAQCPNKAIAEIRADIISKLRFGIQGHVDAQ